MKDSKIIWIYADWMEIEHPMLMGQLRVERGRDEVFSFTYDPEWLASRWSEQLDPDLLLFDGPQYPREPKPNFGLFSDSAPDRWGRMLMQRKENYQAALESRTQRKLRESDFLLGVADLTRMGALRFKLAPDGPFLDDNSDMAAPPIAELRALEAASLHLEEQDAESKGDYANWMKLILAPGSSLGGARPKASVIDAGRQLWIAKFPSKADPNDTGAWEAVVNQLAKEAGIIVAEGRAMRLTVKQHTYLTKRFDRTPAGGRIHFASAMTLLGLTDGQDGSTGVSYLHLAEFIQRHGARPNSDMEELWKRIVLNICVSNSDDHLRNHGFLLIPSGWVLSPAYDINPIPGAEYLKLNITTEDGRMSLELALSVASQFRVGLSDAKKIMGTIQNSVTNWRKYGEKFGISRGSISQMAQAFSLEGKQ
jgi:serine/threonine-protein kinase HipA